MAAVAVAAAVAWLLRGPIAVALVERTALARLSADAVGALPDGLHVGLCGAGSPFPDPLRGGPCTMVLAGRRLLVVDAGNGALRGLTQLGFEAGRVDAVLLTHLHSDHLDGLGELMLQRWVGGGRATPVPVHGPTGVEAVVDGLAQVYAADRGYRVAHHGAAIVPPGGAGGTPRPIVLGPDGRAVVIADGDLEVVAFAVDHEPVHPALGYRIRYRDRTVVLSGDTRQSEAVRREAEGVDLLVHDALSRPLLAVLARAAATAGRENLVRLFADIVDYHATPEQAAETARDARVGYLLLNHIVPPLPLTALEGTFLGDAPRIWSGPIRVGRDGDLVSMPAGTRDIAVSRR
ncbi:MAG: MBL fold metallo-hydrolase [Burkholderiales bacterium]|nr:MAG: MBL fold metallo-hydrolase [Burkholderiales bacterium]